ncbi:MAG: tRNA (adenosine(37)-N6)-dimethylallyltransferase MiaA [Kiritimatiellia bacterium]|nr:tRNA (adenosine(37)-N6)-dimethylallyltransferase MiaA [Kiritimatiellia bacterium]
MTEFEIEMENICPRPDLKAFFLVGPTATGKTSVSQQLAEHYSYDILSADAMMVYRDMDIGTAKPGQAFRAKVCYWGLDLVSARAHFSVGMYREHALAAIREATSAGRQIIVAGGTGLYIKSLTHGLSRLPAENMAVRIKAEKLMEQDGIGALREWAKAQFPAAYESVADKTNPRRLIRAIEIAGFSAEREKNTWLRIGKGPKIAGLLMPMAQLYERIQERVRTMYADGLLDEVERLLTQGFSAGGGEISPTAGKAIGYAEAIHFLRGNFTLDEAMELTAKRTRQLAKRQMTWFRNQANVEWLTIDSGMTPEQIARMVRNCWGKIGPTPIAV